MAAKFVVLAALVALAHCAEEPAAQVDSDSSSFSYDVADSKTGDYKSQVETRTGGNVVGQYSLLQPDGTKRIVDYTANDANGFNAVVRNDPAVVATAVVTAAPVTTEAAVTAAPAPAKSAEPVIVSARAYPSPFFYAARAVPSVYPSLYNPSVYPSVYNPSVYSTAYGHSVYSNAYGPSVYASPVPWAAPTTYSAYW